MKAKINFSASSILFILVSHNMPVKTKRSQAIVFRTLYQHALDFLDFGEQDMLEALYLLKMKDFSSEVHLNKAEIFYYNYHY